MSDRRPVLVSSLVAALVAAVVAAIVGALVAAAVTVSLQPAGQPAEDERHDGDGPAAAVEDEVAPVGEDVRGTLIRGPEAVRTFVFDLPPDAIHVDFALESSAGDVDLYLAFGGGPPTGDGQWCFEGTTTDPREAGHFTRHDHADFGEGALFAQVDATQSGPGVGEDGDEVPFRLRVDVVRAQVAGEIGLGEAFDGTVGRATGFRQTVAVRVPAGTEAIRIDLEDAERDLELFVAATDPLLDLGEALAAAETPLARESLVVELADHPELAGAGRVFVHVVDVGQLEDPVRYRLRATAGREPPPEVLRLPPIPAPTDPLERALLSVVDVGLPSGSGSGTIVSARGFILTAEHVVIGTREGEPDVVIALTLDPRRIAVELFRARVVRRDPVRDLALLEIVAGLHGQPLPEGLALPVCPLARDWEPRLGEALTTIGYPEPGGSGMRVPITISRGVVAGFDRGDGCRLVKTDALIASGSSGGAAVDERHRLVGVPISKRAETDGNEQLGYLVPLEAVPAEWWRLIEGGGR